MEPVRVQETVWIVPTVHCSVPLGAVRVKAPAILKFVSDRSVTVASAVLLMRTLTLDDMASGTVQVYL